MTVHLFDALGSTVCATQRIERKFFVAPKQVGIALGLMRQVCRPDAEHPTGQINSLYFDTLDLEVYQDSQSGDFGRDKVRIRWYGEDGGLAGTRTVYVELKSKQGFVGAKWRSGIQVPALFLTRPYLARGIVPGALLRGALYSFGYFPSKALYPVVKIAYRRHRFVEPLTGERVALDSQIRSTMVMPRPGNGETDLELVGAIIEVKGSSVELPQTLKSLGVLDVDWSRLSKYSACVEAHGERPGAIGRLSPSGRVIQ